MHSDSHRAQSKPVILSTHTKNRRSSRTLFQSEGKRPPGGLHLRFWTVQNLPTPLQRCEVRVWQLGSFFRRIQPKRNQDTNQNSLLDPVILSPDRSIVRFHISWVRGFKTCGRGAALFKWSGSDYCDSSALPLVSLLCGQHGANWIID